MARNKTMNARGVVLGDQVDIELTFVTEDGDLRVPMDGEDVECLIELLEQVCEVMAATDPAGAREVEADRGRFSDN